MTIAAAKVSQLDLVYQSYTPVLALITGDLSSFTFTANSGTDTFTATGHDFIDGVPVQLSNSGGALPGGVGTQTYFVIGVSGNDFQLSESIGGTAIALSSNGSGTNTVTEVALGDDQVSSSLINRYDDASLAWDIAVRHELADYQGGGRVSFSWDAATKDATTNAVAIAEKAVSVIPSTGNVDFRYAAVIRGGNTTQGDATGSIEEFRDVGDTTISIQGKTLNFTPRFP